MPIKKQLPPFRRGRRVNRAFASQDLAGSLNTIQRELLRTGELVPSAGGPITIQHLGTGVLYDLDAQGIETSIPAVITANNGGGSYNWQEAVPGPNGTLTPLPGGRTGTVIDPGGNTGMPNGTPLLVVPGITSDPNTGLPVNGIGSKWSCAGPGMVITGLPTPSAPTIANVGTAGVTTYSYTVVAKSATGSTLASTAGTTTTGNATLNGSHYNTVTVSTPTPGAVSYDIYRTVGGASQGLIGNIPNTGALVLNDTGLAGSGSSPTLDTSENINFGAGVLSIDASGNITWTYGGITYILNGVSGPTLPSSGPGPTWQAFTVAVSGANFVVTNVATGGQTTTALPAGLSQTLTIEVPASGSVVSGAGELCDVGFVGTGIATVSLNLGDDGSITQYLNSQSIHGAAVGPTMANPSTLNRAYTSGSGVTTLKCQISSTGANLNQLTAGKVTINFLIGTVPQW